MWVGKKCTDAEKKAGMKNGMVCTFFFALPLLLFSWGSRLDELFQQFTLVTGRPYCPGRSKELCFTMLSLAMETMGIRLSINLLVVSLHKDVK